MNYLAEKRSLGDQNDGESILWLAQGGMVIEHEHRATDLPAQVLAGA